MTVAELLDIMTIGNSRGTKIIIYDLDSDAGGKETEVELTQKGFTFTPKISSYREFAHRRVNSIHVNGGRTLIFVYGVEE